MKWIDYREKLGIGLDDEDIVEMFGNKLAISFKQINFKTDYEDYGRKWDSIINDYCYCVGISTLSFPYEIIGDIVDNDSIKSILCRYIAFANIYCVRIPKKELKTLVWDILYKALDDLNIPYEMREDADGKFIFPKGAKELDDALVSEPLEWLKDYPGAHKTFVIALKQYSEGIYIRDVADNLRKALETFLQEFLGNTRNLESNKNEICKYLGEQNVDAGISGLYQSLINSYKNLNDRIAKHNDAVDKKLLEFLLYQTGILIRTAITIKKEEVITDEA